MLTEKTLYYDPALLQPWHAGKLPKQWFQEHPHIFDKDDLRITRRQLSRHFGEWFVAIHYAEQGYGVLVEKYIYKNHPCKERIPFAVPEAPSNPIPERRPETTSRPFRVSRRQVFLR